MVGRSITWDPCGKRATTWKSVWTTVVTQVDAHTVVPGAMTRHVAFIILVSVLRLWRRCYGWRGGGSVGCHPCRGAKNWRLPGCLLTVTTDPMGYYHLQMLKSLPRLGRNQILSALAEWSSRIRIIWARRSKRRTGLGPSNRGAYEARTNLS